MRVITGIARYAVKKLIASPRLKEFWKTEISFQSLNSASFTGFPLKRKSIAFNYHLLSKSRNGIISDKFNIKIYFLNFNFNIKIISKCDYTCVHGCKV